MRKLWKASSPSCSLGLTVCLHGAGAQVPERMKLEEKRSKLCEHTFVV